jgi:hypothetical protein
MQKENKIDRLSALSGANSLLFSTLQTFFLKNIQLPGSKEAILYTFVPL